MNLSTVVFFIVTSLLCTFTSANVAITNCNISNNETSSATTRMQCTTSFGSYEKSGVGGGAELKKNRVKGPADLGIYYINSPGVACGGFKTSQCSTSCGALGYPVYWCYPKVCYCHFGTEEENNEVDDIYVPE